MATKMNVDFKLGVIQRDRKSVDFHDIVDRDKFYYEQHSSQLFVGSLIESLPLRIGILVAIILNSIVVGLQTNKRLDAQYGAIFLGLDKFFQTLFAIEILMKWYHDFLGFWRVGWNIFDFFIVGISFIVPGVNFLSGIRIVHVLRVLQATRSLRSISTLHGLQTVMQTVLYSIPEVAYVMTLLLFCVYIFAILGHAIFGDDCPQNFGTVERTMFSLFICMTQDGWLKIVMELNNCGFQVIGAIYLVIFITIGAFIFANLVVAVVVTNLEWVIAEKNQVEKKLFIIKQDAAAEELPSVLSKFDEVFKTARFQKSLALNPQPLNNFLALISSLEENFSQFMKYKDELTKIQQEIQALETLDEGSVEEQVEPGTAYVSRSPSRITKKQSRSNLAGGDVMTEMLGLMTKSKVQVGQAKSIHHMLNQLVKREPSEQAPNRRPSLMVHPVIPESRRSSQVVDSDLLFSHRGSQSSDIAGRSSHLLQRISSAQPRSRQRHSMRPSSADPRALDAYYGARRHTLSSIPAPLLQPQQDNE